MSEINVGDSVNSSYPSVVPGLMFQYAGLCDIGRRRKKNEDAMGFVADEQNGAFLMVVADGVGGNAAGDVASRLAVDTYYAHFEGLTNDQDLGAFLQAGMEAVNLAIFNEAAQNPLQAGMATTCTAAIVRGQELRIAHVGDCRAYLMHEGNIHQLTQDHSAAADYERNGLTLPPEKKHLQNVLTRCLGLESSVLVDVIDPVGFTQDGILVQCSDGLLKMVEPNEILHTVSMHLPDRACQRLVDLANERGGPDNITVQVARYRKE